MTIDDDNHRAADDEQDERPTRPLLCPWCQRELRPTEMVYRPRLERLAATGMISPVYLACERCAWDIDDDMVPPLRVLH